MLRFVVLVIEFQERTSPTSQSLPFRAAFIIISGAQIDHFLAPSLPLFLWCSEVNYWALLILAKGFKFDSFTIVRISLMLPIRPPIAVTSFTTKLSAFWVWSSSFAWLPKVLRSFPVSSFQIIHFILMNCRSNLVFGDTALVLNPFWLIALSEWFVYFVGYRFQFLIDKFLFTVFKVFVRGRQWWFVKRCYFFQVLRFFDEFSFRFDLAFKF